MKRVEVVRGIHEGWVASHPGSEGLVVEEWDGRGGGEIANCKLQNATCKLERPGESVSMCWFMDSVGVGFRAAVRLLHEEGVVLVVRHEGRRVRYLIGREDAERVVAVHGSEEARRLRRLRPSCRRGEPLADKCRYCGKLGGQWRHHVGADGLERARCSGCGKVYSTRLLCDGRRIVCPACGSADRQIRRRAPDKELNFICGHCRKDYWVDRPDNVPTGESNLIDFLMGR